jgi:NAD(P)-dependent dehydrogenase (short-subunit alcohol dehydrogenase family)
LNRVDDSKRLGGKTAVVLGASKHGNMGQVIARAFAEEGARVLAAGRDQHELAALAESIGGEWALCDITKRQDSYDLARIAKEKLGRIDIVVNTVGTNLLKPFEATPEADLRRVTEAHFIGPFMFFQAMLGAIADCGSVIQMSSATATIMLNDHAAYMGTKAGLDHVIRCIANEYGSRGLRANSISPGLTDTPMTAGAKSIPGVFETYRECYPLGRIGTSEDIAAAAVWLASDECFMTGQNLQVNGGLTLRRNPSRDEVDAAVMKITGKPRPRH